MSTLTSYYVIQVNNRTDERLGVTVDVTNSIHAVEENRARRFDTLEEAQTIVDSLKNMLTVTKNEDVTYKIVKEVREYIDGGVTSESTTF